MAKTVKKKQPGRKNRRRSPGQSKAQSDIPSDALQVDSTQPPIQILASEDPVRCLDDNALAEKFHTPERGEAPYALFLGAGASVTSGIPAAGGMIRHWQQKVFHSLIGVDDDDPVRFLTWVSPENYPNRKEEWRSDGSYREWKERTYKTTRTDDDYSLLFSHFYPNVKERQLLIERLIDKKRPSPGYLFLGGLIKSDIINCVLTTNFDELLHDVLMRFYDIRPIVCAFDSAVGGIRVRSKRPKIIKLHGDFLYDNIKNVKNELRALDTNMEEKMREVCKDSGLVVVGYAGNDESVMHPIRDMLRKPDYLNMGLHWCFMDAMKEPNIPDAVVELAENYQGKVTLYKIRSFDSLMERVFKRNECSWPLAFERPSTYNVLNEFCESVTATSSEPPSPFVANQLENLLRRAKESEDPWTEIQLADALHRQGAHARARNDLDTAVRRFMEADKLLANMGKDPESCEPNAYVRILRRKCGLKIAFAKIEAATNRKNAIKNLREALAIIATGIAWMAKADANTIEKVDATYFRTLPFNGCCALGLLDDWGEPFTEEVVQQVVAFIRMLIKFDPSQSHVRKLCDESYDQQGDGRDFRLSLLTKVHSQLEKEFGKLG